jgi:hypothetical protein
MCRENIFKKVAKIPWGELQPAQVLIKHSYETECVRIWSRGEWAEAAWPEVPISIRRRCAMCDWIRDMFLCHCVISGGFRGKPIAAGGTPALPGGASRLAVFGRTPSNRVRPGQTKIDRMSNLVRPNPTASREQRCG